MQGGILLGLCSKMNMHLYLVQEFNCSFMKQSQQLIWEELNVYTVCQYRIDILWNLYLGRQTLSLYQYCGYNNS